MKLLLAIMLALGLALAYLETHASESPVTQAPDAKLFLADVSLAPYGSVAWTGIDGKPVYGAGAQLGFGLTKNLAVTAFGEADNTENTFIDRAGLGLRYTAWAGTKLSLDGGVQGCYDFDQNNSFLRLPLGVNLYLVKSDRADVSLRAAYAFDIAGDGKHGSATGRAFLGPVLNFKF